MSEFEPIMQQKLGDILVNLVGSKIKKIEKAALRRSQPRTNVRRNEKRIHAQYLADRDERERFEVEKDDGNRDENPSTFLRALANAAQERKTELAPIAVHLRMRRFPTLGNKVAVPAHYGIISVFH